MAKVLSNTTNGNDHHFSNGVANPGLNFEYDRHGVVANMEDVDRSAAEMASLSVQLELEAAQKTEALARASAAETATASALERATAAEALVAKLQLDLEAANKKATKSEK